MSGSGGRELVMVKGLGPGLSGLWGVDLLRGQLGRLREAFPGCDPVYVAAWDDPLANWSREHGVRVIGRSSEDFVRELRQEARGATLVAVVSAAAPFVLPEILRQGLHHIGQGRDAVFFTDCAQGLAPDILLRPELIDRLTEREIRDGFFARIREANPQAAMVEHAYAHARLLELLLGSLRVESETDLAKVTSSLEQAGLSRWTPERAAGYLTEEHARHIDLLEGLPRECPLPGVGLPELNERLALLEYHFGSCRLDSFPVDVCLNLVDACDARCVFCGYHGQRSRGQTARGEHLERLDWLRFARTLMLHGGYGEPLLHPKFPAIVARLKERFPALEIGVPTNGGRLDGERLAAALDHLDLVRVSLNAATPGTHARLMPPMSWERVVQNVRNLVTRRDVRGRGPRVGLNYVFYRDNAEELTLLPELAAEWGVDFLSVDHCRFGVSPLVDWSLSMRERPDEANAILAEVAARCARLGLECVLPPPFTGGPLLARPDFCNQPWTHLFVAHDCSTFVCCDMDLFAMGLPTFDWLDAAAFRDKVWNAPGLRRLRRSLGGEAWPPQCRACRSQDRNRLGAGIGEGGHEQPE